MPSHKSSPVELLSLPNELLLIIAESLPTTDISNLIKTCNRFALLLQKTIYAGAADFKVKNNLPALAWAADNGRNSMVQAILDGAKEPIKNSTLLLALYMACQHSNAEVAEMILIILPVAPEQSDNKAAKYFFVGMQSSNMTEKARNRYVSEDEDLSVHLYTAARNECWAIVYMLFAFPMRDFAKARAFLAVTEEGHIEAARILLDIGMKDEPECVSRAIFSAVRKENIDMPTGEIDKELLDLRDGIRLPDMTHVFVSAAQNANYFYIKTMLDLGDRCPLEPAVFAPALRSAAGSQLATMKMISLIIEAGGKRIIKEDLTRALFNIAKFERPFITRLLLEKGADPSRKLNTGMTALHLATFNRRHVTAKLHISYGSDVSAGADILATDNRDLTPLHLAANHGSYEVAQLLLQHGADPWEQTPDGWMPLNLAAVKEHDRVLEALLATQKVPFRVEERRRIIDIMEGRYPDF
ncbi:ankyrin repeat protein [Trichophyton equinum CBS 127.97]|uniref:Ankyrin repeat protein n=1 Tax=Trichophyton equinum (strain ATCC MYA-4606 / CBS 127.97) TaxID=559882 RepID=F2PRS5_TRIEC|nr:ankyrin repeat protein [Trichophyton equinum CBS 127.97]